MTSPVKLYMVRTHGGRRFYARASHGGEAIRLVNGHLAYWHVGRGRPDYAVNAYNWDDQRVVPA